MNKEYSSIPRPFFSRLPVQILLLSILCVIFFWEAITAGSDKIIAGLDILYIHYYAREFTLESLLRGSIPKWNPYEYCGMPFAADPNNCVFYPFNKFFLFLPIAKAITLNIVLHTLFAGIGTLLLGRSIGLRRGGAFVAAVSFMLSGYFIDRIVAGHEFIVMASAYLPWIFLCYEKASQKENIKWALVGGLLLGLQTLAGSGQITLYTALFLGIYAIARSLSQGEGERKKNLLRDLVYLPVIGAIGLGFSAILTLPALELARHSIRADATMEFIGRSSFPPKNFMHMLFPHLDIGSVATGWEFTSYIGVFPLVLALSAIAVRRHRKVLAFAAVGICALAIMTGRFNPLFPLMTVIIPALKFFRVHARAELGLMFAVAMLAGMAWEIAFSGNPDESKRMHRGLIAVSAIMLLLGLAITLFAFRAATPPLYRLPFPGSQFGQIVDAGRSIQHFLDPKFIISLSLMLISVLGSLALRTKIRRYLLVPLLALIVIDPFAINAARIRLIDTDYLTEGNKMIDLIRSDNDSGYYRVWLQREFLFATRAKYFKIFSADGFSPLALKDLQHYGASLLEKEGDYRLSGANTTAVTEVEELDPYFNNILNVKYVGYRSPDERTPVLRTNNDVLPRAFFVTDYARGTPEEFLTSGIDPRKTVFLHDDFSGFLKEEETVSETDVTIDSYLSDEITLSVQAPSNGFVVLSEAFYPGWRAEVDGIDAEVLKGDFFLRVVPVSKGQHKLRIFYAPTSLLLGKIISLFTAIVVAGTLVCLHLRSKRPPNHDTPQYDN